MSVRYGLLALLEEAPSHGYHLKTAFERRTGGNWALNIGQVYTTIQRLERDGLVEAVDGHATAADDRREYRITPTGRAQLGEWFDNPVVLEAPARDELTIKVLLAVAAGDIDVTALCSASAGRRSSSSRPTPGARPRPTRSTTSPS